MPDKIGLFSSALLGGGTLSLPPPLFSLKRKKHLQEREGGGDLSSLTSLLWLPISTPPPHNYQIKGTVSRDSSNFPLFSQILWRDSRIWFFHKIKFNQQSPKLKNNLFHKTCSGSLLLANLYKRGLVGRIDPFHRGGVSWDYTCTKILGCLGGWVAGAI